MRSIGSIVAAAIVIGTTPLNAQTAEPPARDRLTYDVGAGVSRFGPHAFGGLEASMNRWLAIRGEGLFSPQSEQNLPGSGLTSIAMSAVLSPPDHPRVRVSPYAFGGYALSLGQGRGPQFGPLAGAGIRFRVGKVQPFIEARAHHRIGVPLSLGIRF
jgi:hypothetical protein